MKIKASVSTCKKAMNAINSTQRPAKYEPKEWIELKNRTLSKIQIAMDQAIATKDYKAFIAEKITNQYDVNDYP